MGITEAGRKALDELPNRVDTELEIARRGRSPEDAVDEVLKRYRGTDLRVVQQEMLIDAREELRSLDRARAEVLRQIADLCSKLGMAAETRELL